jgi:flagellar FliJ protein
VKAFRFRLERVLDLRENQLKAEESKLEQLWARRKELENEIHSMDMSIEQARSSTTSRQFVQPSDLIALELFARRTDREREQAQARLRAHDEIVEKQKQAVVEARGRVRLLERLREKRQTEWQTAADKELEELAADFAGAQWLRLQQREESRTVDRFA